MAPTFKQFLSEAKYSKKYKDAGEVFERYMAFFKHSNIRQYGQLTLLEYDLSEDEKYASMYIWATNMTEEQAEHDTREFAKQYNLPYTGINTETATPGDKDTVRSRIHITLYYKDQE